MSSSPLISFEFFPPKTPESLEKLKHTINILSQFNPPYFSVTYGAGGSTRGQTFALVKYIKENTAVPPAAHLTCVGALREETDEIARNYLNIGVNRIIALRGDVPGFTGKYQPQEGGYAYADEMVKGLNLIGKFDISVAAYPESHPEATSLMADIEHLKRKQDAGAARAITQYCFDTDTILRFIDTARQNGITMPIVPGILTISNFTQTINFSARCGATVPNWVHELFANVKDNQQHSDEVAAELAFKQCQRLMQNGIKQFHIYSLNRHEVATLVCNRI